MELLGLTESEGKVFLESQAITEGIEDGLQQLVQIAEGHFYLLKLAASWLKQKAQGEISAAGLSFFERLFRQYKGNLEAKVEEIFAELFAELPERLRSLLLGVVVYSDAFGLEMAQAMLVDASIEDLRSLTERAFLYEESEQWTLHPLMQNLVEQQLQSSERYQESHQKAIAYFLTNLKPSPSTIKDCTEQLEIFHHWCELGKYALANQIMGICVNFLYRRGYYRDLLLIHERLTEAWTVANPDDAEEQHNLSRAWARLGNLYQGVGQFQAAIFAYEKVHVLSREIACSGCEASSLGNLGNAYHSLGEYQRAIDLHQQHYEMARKTGDRQSKAASLLSLGNAYHSLGEYQQAIDSYQRCLEIMREIGNRYGEASSLFNKAKVLAKYEPRRFEALTALQQAREIFTELKLDHEVENCDEVIRHFNEIIATEQHQSAPVLPSTPTIDNAPPKDDWYDRSLPTKTQPRPPSQRQINWLLWFCVGLAIVLLITWLRK